MYLCARLVDFASFYDVDIFVELFPQVWLFFSFIGRQDAIVIL
jgi:hypothetical protein